MTGDLELPGQPASALEPAQRLSGPATDLVFASLAPATREAYAADWTNFTRWAEQADLRVLPAAATTVCDYLANLAQPPAEHGRAYSVSTITRRLAAINAAHALAGITPPGQHPHVRAVMAGIRRTLGPERPIRRARPLLTATLREVLGSMPTTWPGAVTATRDSALLLIGFAGAYRRSELTHLSAGDVTFHPEDGLHLWVARSKTDQEGRGAIKAIPRGANPDTCPVCHLHRWLRVLAATDRPEIMRATMLNADGRHHCQTSPPALPAATPVFQSMSRHGHPNGRPMSGQAVGEVVKTRLAGAGLDPAPYSGHSLRAGFVTQVLRAGATVHEVMNQTLHTNPATVQTYARHHNPLDANAVTRIGL